MQNSKKVEDDSFKMETAFSGKVLRWNKEKISALNKAYDRKFNNNKDKVHPIPHQQWYKYFPMTVIGDFCKIIVCPFSGLLYLT